MNPLRKPKPHQLAEGPPRHPSSRIMTGSTELPSTRQTSFSKLLNLARDRAGPIQSKQTRDDSARGEAGQWSPMVMVDQPQQGRRSAPRIPITDVMDPRSREDPIVSLIQTARRAGILDKQHFSSVTQNHPEKEGQRPPHRLPSGQAAQFRKVSAPRALRRPEGVGAYALPRERPVSTPPNMRFADQTQRVGSPAYELFSRCSRLSSSSSPSRPSHLRAHSADGQRRACRSSTASSPPSDLNRPLPPLPKELSPLKRHVFKRKAVPPPLALPSTVGFDFDSYEDAPLRLSTYASGNGAMKTWEYIRGTLKAMEERDAKREKTLQQELEDAIRPKSLVQKRYNVEAIAAVGKEPIPATTSESGDEEELVTPHTQRSLVDCTAISRSETTSDTQLARSLQEYFNEENFYDELERLQITYDRNLAKKMEEETLSLPLKKTDQTDERNRTKTPPRQFRSQSRQSEPFPDCYLPTKGDPAWHVVGRSPKAVNALVKHDTIPIGSDEPGKMFIPSGRSFEPVRHARRSSVSPLRHGRRPVEQINAGQVDIEHLRHELRPMRTGERVKSAVEHYEVKSQMPDQPAAPSTPVAVIGKIFDRPSLVCSEELTIETKRMMAEARERRHGVSARHPFEPAENIATIP